MTVPYEFTLLHYHSGKEIFAVDIMYLLRCLTWELPSNCTPLSVITIVL